MTRIATQARSVRPIIVRSREEPYNPNCWLAAHGVHETCMPPCDGRLVRAHLISQQTLYRELGRSTPHTVIWDPRILVWACGGVTGVSGHHGALDSSRRLRIPRERLPAGVEEFAREHGLMWYLEQCYGSVWDV